ncbi:MAG: hypothetical protein WKG32_19720 [Gemmatimonadaceae bacterium]
MLIAILNIIVALVLGYGAIGEFIVLGVNAGQRQPFFAGLAGAVVSLMLLASGIALWRRWPAARQLTIVAAALMVVFHVYAALPPHRNVGILILVLAAGYGLLLLIVFGLRVGPGKRAAS